MGVIVTLQTGIQDVPSWNRSWDSSCPDFSSVTPDARILFRLSHEHFQMFLQLL